MVAYVHNPSLEHLQNLQSNAAYYKEFKKDTIRIKALKQMAAKVGLQGGLAAESKIINRILSLHATQLDQIFNFNLVLYQNNILPPVLVQANDTVTISQNGDVMRLGGQTYKIIRQIRFVTTPPTWRGYLWMDYQPPKMPFRGLLPQNDTERKIWKQTVADSWIKGEQQAISIYQVNLHRLVRDFTGMVLYKELLTEHMVSPFATVKKNQGVTGDGNKMTIDNRVMNITAKPQLQLHTKFWKPALVAREGNQ